MDQRTRRSPARFLAPLALIAVSVALLAIITGSSGNGASNGLNTGITQTTGSAGASKTGTTNAAKAKPQGPRSYVVKIGDSMSSIANKTGVSLARLQELNPNVDSNMMTAGQRIRLR